MNKMSNRVDEKVRNTTDKDLVELAGYHAYKINNKKDYLTVNGIEYKVVDKKYKDPSGLDAITVQKVGTKELTIVYVGTQTDKEDGLKDGITDLELLGDVPPVQLKAADKYYETMKDKYEKDGYKIKSICGNSLAGALVGYIAIKHPEIKGVTLNPALLPKGVIKPNKKYSNITNYFSKYDPLTLLEKSGYLTGRIPGTHYIINNGIPEINKEKGFSNHIGYNIDQYYVIGVKGKPGYGKIYIGADDHIATSVWRGIPLYGGHSKQIKINKYELDQLVDALNNDIHNVQYARVNSYLTNSKEIVDDEGKKITQRISKLQSEYEQTFEESAGSNLFKGIAQTSNRLSNEIDNLITLLDSAESKSKVVNRIINSVPNKMIEYVVCNAIAEFAFEEARNLLGNLARKVRELSNGINYIIEGFVPNLIKMRRSKI